MTDNLSPIQANIIVTLMSIAILSLIGFGAYLHNEQVDIRKSYVPLEQYRVDSIRRDEAFCRLESKLESMGIRINDKLDKLILSQDK